MAERLPRYRPLGITVPSVGSVDFTLAARTQAAGLRNMASSLDRMSAFAFKQASEQAATEGQEYGVLNAPTPAQIEAAGADGTEELFPGDERTVFGKAARKAAILTATASIESAATKEITQLRLKAEQDGMDIQTFAQDIENIVTGYASALDGVSPVAGTNFRASMMASGNSAVLKHAEVVMKAAEEREQEDAALTIDAVLNETLPDIFAVGSTFATESGQEYVPMSGKLKIERARVERQARRMGNDEDVRRELKRFDDNVDALYTQTMADKAMVNPLQSLTEFQSGVFSDPRMRDMYKNMSPDQRTAARSALGQRLSAEMALASQIDAQLATDRNVLKGELVGKIAEARVSGDSAKVDELLNELQNVDGEAFASLALAVENEGVKDDAAVVVDLEVALFNNVLTKDRVLQSYKDGELSHTTFKSFISKMDGRANKAYNNAMTFVKNELVPDVSVGLDLFGEDAKKSRKAAKKVAQIENFLMLHLQTKPDTDPLSFVRPLVDEAIKSLDTSKADEYAAATTAISNLINDKILRAGQSEQEMINAIKNSSMTNKGGIIAKIKIYHSE